MKKKYRTAPDQHPSNPLPLLRPSRLPLPIPPPPPPPLSLLPRPPPQWPASVHAQRRAPRPTPSPNTRHMQDQTSSRQGMQKTLPRASALCAARPPPPEHTVSKGATWPFKGEGGSRLVGRSMLAGLEGSGFESHARASKSTSREPGVGIGATWAPGPGRAGDRHPQGPRAAAERVYLKKKKLLYVMNRCPLWRRG